MVHYYVYYRVACPGETASRDVVQRMLASVKAATGVVGRLLMRTDDPGTWMEVYEGVAATVPFEAALALAVEQWGFAGIIAADSKRHIERFRAL